MTMSGSPHPLEPHLLRIAEALERLAPRVIGEGALNRIASELEKVGTYAESRTLNWHKEDFRRAEVFVWNAEWTSFRAVPRVNRTPIALLRGVDRMRDKLLDNTENFARGLPANNALLWGSRGMGKSSLVKAVHAEVAARQTARGGAALKLVEIHREDIESLPRCLSDMRESAHRFIVFCDDLSFDADDTAYKSLKAVLEGGVEGRPGNVLFYATSNRRHLMAREMVENERSTAIHQGEAVEEKVSLSDRFGLWLGFHNCSQADYLAMVDGYAAHYGLKIGAEDLKAQALEWAMTRGSRSGRVAWQFIQDLAGRLGQALEN